MAGLRSEACWLGGGHLVVAVAGIAGIALLTRVMDAATFGALSLAVGIGGLAMAVLVNPIIQTGMRFFSSANDKADLQRVRSVTRRWLMALLLAAFALVLAIGIAAERLIGISWHTALLIAALLSVDSFRAYETSMLNAARQQRSFVLWRATDSWVRPVVAVLCVIIFGVEVWPALLGYVLGSALVSVVFVALIRPSEVAARLVHARERPTSGAIEPEALMRYALPLVPMGALGWVLGSGDRFIIGGMLSLEAAGLYVAVYSISSRPFLALGSLFDVLLRPRLYDAASAEDWRRFNYVFLAWLASSLVVALLMAATATLLSAQITRLLLGPDFVDSARLMPWIALGYVFVTAYQPLARVMHAYLQSRLILAIQVVTVVIGVSATVIGVRLAGIDGAAIAVPVYFALRLVIAFVLVARTPEARRTFLRFTIPAARASVTPK